jgi:hypothetical protein
MLIGPNDRIADRRFANPEKGYYRLKKRSPAIVSGTTLFASSLGINGLARPRGKGIDRGAHKND